MNHLAAILIAFGLGLLCRNLNVQLPAPPTFFGVFLIFCLTFGWQFKF